MLNTVAFFLYSTFNPFFFLIPFSFFLTLKGIEVIVKRKPVPAIVFVGAVAVMTLGIAAFFVFIAKIPVPYWLLNFSLPFGAGSFLIFEEHPENSITARAFAFVTGVLCNALAMVCLIDFGQRIYRLNKKINAFAKSKEKEEII